MATTPQPTPVERNAALGRVARTDVVAFVDSKQAQDYGFVENLAVKRLITQKLSNSATADMDYGGILKLLEEARLTISLKAPNWFYYENKSKTYGNFWERGSSGASNDAKKRDGAENSMFGYTSDVRGQDAKVVEAQNRLLNLGSRPSANFQPSMRPRYSAVDFAYCTNGALSKYGKSFLVLKEHLKHNATFTHCDSFEVDADLMERKAEYENTILTLADVTCSYFQLGYIVAFCHPAILRKLHSYAMGQTNKASESNILGGMIYIEAQLHADIQFDRDVAELHVSGQDCSNGPIPHPKSQDFFGKKTVWDGADIARVKENAKTFCERNKIAYRQAP